MVWRLYIQSELDILEKEYPAGANAPCTVNITLTFTVKKCTVANLKIAGDTLPRFVLAHFADRLTFNESYILTPNI